MNVNARRCASLALALLLAATLVPAHGLAKTKADATANNTTAESAEDTDAVSASTDTTVDSDADDTESTTDTDKKSKKVKEPVTIVSSNLAYRVRTATTWGEYVDSGGQAGTADRRATGLQFKKIAVEKSNGKTAQQSAYTFEVYANGTWTQVKTAKQFTSSAYPIEAIRLKLTGTIATTRKIIYRVKVENFGWLSWTKSGKAAGTKDQKLGICQIQARIVKKNKKLPKAAKLPACIGKPSLVYAASLRGNAAALGKTKKNGSTAGKANYAARIDRLKVSLAKCKVPGSVRYRVRTGSSNASGWSSWRAGGKTAGAKGTTVQAVQIELTGAMAKYYDVYYRAYCGDRYWRGWAKNGKTAGTGGIGYPLGALQAVLVPKGSGAPGYISGAYVTKGATLSGYQLSLLRKAQGYSSSTSYLIFVDRSMCKVIIFKRSASNWSLLKYWDCCVGAPATPTIKGTFTTGYKMYSFGEKKGYSCYYATQIHSDYLFHSILYYANTRNVMDGTMGAQVSHGCIRLWIDNAKWIYDNIHSGTKVAIW